jgi:kynurenine 3-monooxygenase
MSAHEPIVIVGAGPAGCMCALLLGRRCLPIILLEQRSDFREESTYETKIGRKLSINFGLSYRGISALKRVGLYEKVQPFALPMRGRFMHMLGATNLTFQPYGTGDQAIFSVSRGKLTKVLLDEVEKLSNVQIRFGIKVQKVDDYGTVEVHNARGTGAAEFISSRLLIGADGIYSRVRSSLIEYAQSDFSQNYIEATYKELSMPCNDKGEFPLSQHDGLHIWPRGDFMMIGAPNPDKSFTCTLFAPKDDSGAGAGKGAKGLDSIKTHEEVLAYFKTNFPDVISLMPNLCEEFFVNPTRRLSTVRCKPWHYKDKIVLIGDAAHAVVPFYGQGINAAFEDCLLLDKLWAEHDGYVKEMLPIYSATRQPACDALADMTIEHYAEMREKTASTAWLLKKKFENFLHAKVPSLWIPAYTMVTFTNIPYHEARKRSQLQNRVLFLVISILALAIAIALLL